MIGLLRPARSTCGRARPLGRLRGFGWPAALAWMALSGPVAAQGVQGDGGLRRADSLVAAWVEEGRIPGAVLVVVRDGKVALERAHGSRHLMTYGDGQYGLAAVGQDPSAALTRRDPPLPMTRGTVFDLASVTKVMATTFALMLLVDRGQVVLDAPVERYLPDFRGGGKEAVTVRHLLTHRSGMLPWVPTYYHASDADAAWAYVRDLPLASAPGSERRYSDLGFMALGRLVERVAGLPLDRFLTEELYAPLGLRDTGFRGWLTEPEPGPVAATSHGNPYEHRMVHDSTFGYRVDGDPEAWDGWRTETLVGKVNDGNAWHAFRGVAGHAGLFSTGRELGVLLQLLLDRGMHEGRRLLSEATLATFLSPEVEGQALGWQVPSYAPAGSFAHTGFTGTWVLGVPERRLAVILLTNRQNLGVDAGGVYRDVAPLQRAVAVALLGGAP